jgi:signal transduction histidine kinase
MSRSSRPTPPPSGPPRDELAEVLALLAHDLKNPLAAIVTNLGFVHGFVDGLDPAPHAGDVEDARDAISDARLACESLQRFVSNLEILARDLARARTDRADGPPLDLAALADEVVGRQRASAEARRVELLVETAGATWVRGDRDAIVRAVDNLLANGIQHAPAGTPVAVVVEPWEGDVAITVIDQGQIVPEGLRAEAISRIGQARSKGQPEARYGRGLGLYVAAVSAGAGGGRIEIGSRDGRSTLSIVLRRFEE